MSELLKNRRILVLTTVPETARAFLLPQLKDLREHGAQVHLATGEKGCSLPELADLEIIEHRLPLERAISPFKDLRAMFTIIRLCRKYRFDLIHTHTLKASLVGQLGARFAGVPVRVETAHGTRYMPDLPFFVRTAILWSERLAAQQAHRVWVLNQEDFDFFKSHHLAKDDALHLLGKGGIGVDLARFRPDGLTLAQRYKYRQSLGLPGDAMVAGFVGRLVKDKGVRELIEAWPSIIKVVPTAHLLIVTAQLESECSNEVIDRECLQKLPNTIILTNRTDMPELFNCVDVLVLPSYREGFSRVILEASACGVPVIASDVRGCRDAVVNGLTGILIPPHNAAKVTEAVINLLQDNARSTQLGQQARLYAEKYFDQNVVIEHIRTTYETLLKNASGKLK